MLLVVLAVPTTASAQGSCNANGYSNVAGIQSNGNGNGTNPACTVTTASTGNLPFTGLDLGIVLGAGILLVGSGLLLRRLSGSRQS